MGDPGQAARRARVLVVDDDDAVRSMLGTFLGAAGYSVTLAPDGSQGLERLGDGLYDLVLLDLHLPGISGLDLLGAAPELQTDAQVIMMTGDGSLDTAVEAMRRGAYHYLPKPLHLQELVLVLQRALDERDRRRELADLRLRVDLGLTDPIVGDSPPMQRLFEMIRRVAPTRTTVLITGETGTGKELVARAIHRLSDRARRPFVPVHCAALAETVLESELFGHVKGSFTGAVATRRGRLEEASDGTLFLDETSSIPPPVQVKLLRALQERVIQRLGANEMLAVDFRLVAATNVDLAAEVQAGRFREDLFYRLNVFPLQIPPLRERRGDIPRLAAHFLSRVAAEMQRPVPELADASLRAMEAYDWPGNVRELASAIERAMVLHAGAQRITVSLPRRQESSALRLLDAADGPAWTLERLEREYILRTLAEVEGHRGRAAERLGIDRRTLTRKLKEYGQAPSDAD